MKQINCFGNQLHRYVYICSMTLSLRWGVKGFGSSEQMQKVHMNDAWPWIVEEFLQNCQTVGTEREMYFHSTYLLMPGFEDTMLS